MRTLISNDIRCEGEIAKRQLVVKIAREARR
jgi:hypothetical protein